MTKLSLTRLRRTLTPHFGEHVDAAISLIGIEPYRGALNAAKQGHLGYAHTAQVSEYKFRHPGSTEPFLGWKDDVEPSAVPPWFKKPLPALPLKRRTLTWNGGNNSVVFWLGEKKPSNFLGKAFTEFRRFKGMKVLVVHELQQETQGRKVLRKIRGWRHAAMDIIEHHARKNHCRAILFSTGERHSESSTSSKPVHEEMLRTYGRLPMQHGYKLKVAFKFNPPEWRRWQCPKLWWFKKL